MNSTASCNSLDKNQKQLCFDRYFNSDDFKYDGKVVSLPKLGKCGSRVRIGAKSVFLR